MASSCISFISFDAGVRKDANSFSIVQIRSNRLFHKLTVYDGIVRIESIAPLRSIKETVGDEVAFSRFFSKIPFDCERVHPIIE